MRPPHPTPWLTTAEAAEYLRYRSTQGVRDAVRRGQLRAYRRGRTYLFLQEDLDAYLRSQNISPKYCGTPEPLRRSEQSGTPSARCAPKASLERPTGEDPYGLRAALKDDQAEQGSGSHHSADRHQSGQPTPMEK